MEKLTVASSKVICWSLVLLGALFGCSGYEPPDSGARVETSKITGTVLVDGEPAAVLRVMCHPVGDIGVATAIAGLTDEDGKFSVGTYEGGDGAPAGEYRLTFMWGQYGMNGYGGPDKLKGRYSDPEKSEFTCTVVKGKPTDLGEIKLTTK